MAPVKESQDAAAAVLIMPLGVMVSTSHFDCDGAGSNPVGAACTEEQIILWPVNKYTCGMCG